MKDILLVAPYEELFESCSQLIKEKNIKNVEVVLVKTEEEYNLEAIVNEKSPLVVISRGGIYSKIKDMFGSIAVVEMKISAYDIVNSIKEIFDIEEAVAVLGYENITYGFDILETIKKVNVVKVKREEGKDLRASIEECVKKGIKVFMGDTKVTRVCEEMGHKCYLIRSGEASVVSALEKADEILRILKDQMENSKRYEALMDCVHDGVIATDEESRIVAYNNTAQEILGIEKNEFLGKKIDELFPEEKDKPSFYNNRSVYDVIEKINGVNVTLTRIPIKVLDEDKGSVSVFQDIRKLQKFEQKVRAQLSGKGLKAKYEFSDIIYESSVMKKAVDKAKKFSLFDSTVLIQGSSGVGKELFVQSMHSYSHRKRGPFVAINCGALPESIIESELFGYEEGAFTGSKKGGKPGVFEMAHKGTIFLDEISELPINIQSQLLRVIQEREIMRLGDNKVIPLDIRIICATNKSLRKMVEEGKFREDLFFRINTLSFVIPPLKKRIEDIKVLSDFYLEKYCKKYSKEVKGFTPEAIKVLSENEFKGNVRELQNLIERAVILCDKNIIDQKDIIDEDMEDFKNDGTENEEEFLEKDYSLKELENKYINYIFQREEGSVKKACEILKIDRTTLWRKMKDNSEVL